MDSAKAQSTNASQSTASQPPLTIVPSQSQHTHTAVLLHGRGSTGEEFAEEFFDSTHLHGLKSLRDKLPGWRWVFPSSRELWSTAFQEHMPAWFDVYSLTDPTARQELQVDGIVESMDYIESILDEELQRLDNNANRLVLGGISQGGAIALWVLLRQRRRRRRQLAPRLGGFIGASTWLPFAKEFQEIILGSENHKSNGKEAEFVSFVKNATGLATTEDEESEDNVASQVQVQVPVFMGHGVDDAYVSVELGREATQLLSKAGFRVQWKEYSGAELEGYWLKVPEEMDDIYDFFLGFKRNELTVVRDLAAANYIDNGKEEE